MSHLLSCIRILLPLSLAVAACDGSVDEHGETTADPEATSSTDDAPTIADLVGIEAGVAGTLRWAAWGSDDGLADSGPVEGAEIRVTPE